jgi:putative FmdB family regulatory protein
MPIYEYVADRCGKQPVCSYRKDYLQRITDQPLTACRDCGAPIHRVMSSFAARSGSVGASSPDPTPLNITGLPAPSGMPVGGGGEDSCGHEH